GTNMSGNRLPFVGGVRNRTPENPFAVQSEGGLSVNPDGSRNSGAKPADRPIIANIRIEIVCVGDPQPSTTQSDPIEFARVTTKPERKMDAGGVHQRPFPPTS